VKYLTVESLHKLVYFGAITAVVCALCTPQWSFAHGKKGHGATEGTNAQHGQANQTDVKDAEAAPAATGHGDAHDNAQQAEQSQDGSQKKMSHGTNHGHAQQLVDVSRWEYVPAISMEVEKDAMSGWNIRLQPDRFTFTPENVNRENKEGEGHAHLFVDDKKVARLYGLWFHLPALTPGRHSIKVQLNANDHSTLAVGDNPVENITIIEQE